MRVPGCKAIRAIGEEAVSSMEKDEPIPGTQLPDHVWEIILENSLRCLEIEPDGDVLCRHAEVLNQNLLHCCHISLSKLNRTDSLLLVGLNSDQDGVCGSH